MTKGGGSSYVLLSGMIVMDVTAPEVFFLLLNVPGYLAGR